jgi:hypothetical protein
VLDRGFNDALGFRGFGHVAAYGDCVAAGLEDLVHRFVRAAFARGVVDDNGCPFEGEGFGDGCADAFGCASDDRDFSCELVHLCVSFLFFGGW